MKKLISILLLICFTSMFITACDSKNENNAGFESEDTTIILNLDNYKQFLSVSVNASSGNEPSITCNVKPLTTNYDFNNVKINVKATGKYTVHNYVFTGYSSPGVPHYDATIKHSDGNYDELFHLDLSIGGELIKDGSERKDIVLPEGEWFGQRKASTTINSGNISCEYEVTAISGSVSKS